MNQQDLMRRIRSGEELAFAELVNPLIEKAYRTSYGILFSKEQAEEVIQNSLLEAYRGIMSGKEITYFTTWFYKVVTHRSIDLVRKLGRMKETILEIDPITDNFSVEDSLVNIETNSEIKKSISDIDNGDYRNVLLLYYYQEYSIQEISEILKLKNATVKSHLRRARNALKKTLIKNQVAGVNTK